MTASDINAVIAALLGQRRQALVALRHDHQRLLAHFEAVLKNGRQLSTTLCGGVVDLSLQPQQRPTGAGIGIEAGDDVADANLDVRDPQARPRFRNVHAEDHVVESDRRRP